VKTHLYVAVNLREAGRRARLLVDRNPGSRFCYYNVKVTMPNGDRHLFVTQDFTPEKIKGLELALWEADPEARLTVDQWTTLVSRVFPTDTPLTSVEAAARVLEDHDMLEEAEKLRDIYR